MFNNSHITHHPYSHISPHFHILHMISSFHTHSFCDEDNSLPSSSQWLLSQILTLGGEKKKTLAMEE